MARRARVLVIGTLALDRPLVSNEKGFYIDSVDCVRTEENAVARSGAGDGTYHAYWGLGQDDQPVCFLVDFDVIDEDDYTLTAAP